MARPMLYRFCAPERAAVGHWRRRLGTAIVDAVKHLKGWDKPGSTVRITCDARVAMGFLDELKAAGYRFEQVQG